MEAPKLPENKDITYIGYSTYRGEDRLFGIKRKDRRQHMYVLGKSGTGKSVLLSNMIMQNIKNGEGVCVVDPHGELVEGVLKAIPEHRVKDVVYFNPADTDFHIGFNVLEIVDPKYKNLVSSGLMGIFTKIWANAWSARMEYILNNTILALLDTPGTTLLGINRMLVDKDYRQSIISNLKDPVIKAFWIHEFEAWQDKFRNEAIAPIQNKVGQFLSTFVIRNIVGQSKSTINIFDIMNQGKIFLVNVSKGRIGEDNSRLLGGMLITKIQLAAMERVRIPENERRDFYLYVDEFQNFVTDSFASILSEARKYRLNLIVAHQYIAQLVTRESTNVRDAIFGNVGTMMIFRVGAEDTKILEKEFMPEFTPEDIVNLPNYRIYLKLMIDGVTSRPFSAKTIPPLVLDSELSDEVERKVIESSRDLYCRPREEVELEINDWSGTSFGEENAVASGEKFPAICSSCGKDTTVPFKPEPGRPIYCKDCIVKIKSGELKPVKVEKSERTLRTGEYYKPLSDLGIEFAPDGQQVETKKTEMYREVLPKAQALGGVPKPPEASGPKPFPPKKPGFIKKVFGKKDRVDANFQEDRKRTPPDKDALKAALDKAMAQAERKAVNQKDEAKAPLEEKKEEVKPISLSALATPPTPPTKPTNDRGASEEKMSALKSLIMEKAPEVIAEKKPEPAPVKAPEVKIPEPVPEVKTPEPPAPPPVHMPEPEPVKDPEPEPEVKAKEETPPQQKQQHTYTMPKADKEVPEDVLRKILEE